MCPTYIRIKKSTLFLSHRAYTNLLVVAVIRHSAGIDPSEVDVDGDFTRPIIVNQLLLDLDQLVKKACRRSRRPLAAASVVRGLRRSAK